MTAPSVNLSGKIDVAQVELYAAVSAGMELLKVPFLVIGASARDLVLHHGYGAQIRRATIDIDFAVQVPSWQVFTELKQILISKGFAPSQLEHRLISQNGCPIDIVPFGAIADRDANIKWPPPGDGVMTVLGFQEALNSAKMIRLRNAPLLDVPVATVEGMIILKLIAWTDRGLDKRNKDAKDIAYLLASYEEIPAISDLLYQDDSLMEEYKWNLTFASAHQLGKSARQIALPPTQQKIEFLLDKPSSLRVQLINEMSENRSRYSACEALLSAFTEGFLRS